ncbi:uncharacterized protein At4g04980 isoform X1 [Raphanus sativus]|uniref:Uncharacterized protein At4g04980 isoform X1 n=1 Tax=Raphanus sativus TaxID=3726 RepID=A0A9W3DR70_RAPSA|nr:uncharacterized protein At4g04980 isoform X1 [Raphanus sativus]
MSVRTHKVEPVKGQALLTSSKTKQDVKPSLVSPPSSINIMESRSPFISPKPSRRVASSSEDIQNAHRETTNISSSSCGTSKWTGHFIFMHELRRKIITFRGIIELPPLTGYLSITNMVMRTMKDLHKLFPEIVETSCLLDIGRDTDKQQLLDQFYNILKSFGDSWIDDHKWIINSKYINNSSPRKNLPDGLGEECSREVTSSLRRRLTHCRIEKLGKVLAALDGLITGRNEMLNMTEINNEDKKPKFTTPPQSKRALLPSKPVMKQHITPRTVLHPPRDIEISVSNLPRHVRMQALVILSPINVKRLTIQQTVCKKEAQKNDGDDESEKQKRETERVQKAKEAIPKDKDSFKSQTDDDKSYSKCSEKSERVLEPLAPTPPHPESAALPLPQPLPMTAALPTPSPLPVIAAKGPALLPPPPGVSALLPPQPLPMAPGKRPGAPPPPPPLRLGAKKATGKLKRSTKLGELYRFLKAKIEGKDPKPRSRGVRGGSKGVGGKQGMADALAEITKKSPYFQQIEADVQIYMKAINELKTEISSFQGKDMTELQRFHLYIESVLEKLTDETKVLARCEGFPEDKLDAIRTASALHSKLQDMMKELNNWKIESPANLLFDKTERYFAKIRGEIETLDQIKIEEEKKFKRHNIPFDFSILTRIKETMVNISSGCIELALKEKREANITSHSSESRKAKPSMIKNKTVGFAKTLWRAFHFAYRVYIFAGGHDDRADKLTRELGSEIELVLKNR